MVTFLYVLLGIVVLFLVLVTIAPKTYDVKRTVEVQRPLEEVFDYLKYIKNQDNWSPWKKKDPDMKQIYTGTDGEIGFVARWEGNKQVGIGEQEIKAIMDNERVETELRFYKPWESQSDAYMSVASKSEGRTEVTWGFSGVNKPPFNIFFLFFNMDKTVGKDFEEGLQDLKLILEK